MKLQLLPIAGENKSKVVAEAFTNIAGTCKRQNCKSVFSQPDAAVLDADVMAAADEPTEPTEAIDLRGASAR